MSKTIHIFLAALLLGSAPAMAAEPATPRPLAGMDRAAAVGQVIQARAERRAAPRTNATVKPKVMGNYPLTSMPVANPSRAYPPSCLADPLPDQASGPTYRKNMKLYTVSGESGQAVSAETVTVTLWRIACSSSGSTAPPYADGAGNAVTLMRLDRSSGNEGRTDRFPLFPDVRVAQDSVDFDNPNGLDLVRVASEPNTVISETSIDSPLIFSTTYVLENYPYQGSGFFYFNSPFDILLDPLMGDNDFVIIPVAEYYPTQSSYPDAFRTVPMNGFLNGVFYDPAHSGEGLNIQVMETPGANGTLDVAWFTYDSAGIPFWIGGAKEFNLGDGQVKVDLFHTSGGGFAGNFGGNVNRHPWGSVTVSFPDCNTVRFNYASRSGLPQGVPRGNGTREWTRLANINGLICE